ncbi:hypothetical protein F4780DRAFT_794779 [Xylariomycetidae sp. FL0641]|nr:hypothetical protein F4780DRAFT_794779 [Xylariomycetidae sp. FL0641]
MYGQQHHYPPQGHAAPPPQSYPPQGSPYPAQGHYPPPQGSPFPPHQGYYPPPSQSSPYPPHGQYPPPAQPYGASSTQPGYGSHPGYGPPGPAPPGPAPLQYGAPPVQQYDSPPYASTHHASGPPTPPSLGYGPPQPIPWAGAPDAQALRSATKGFGTDEKTLCRVLATKDPLQMEAIKEAYFRLYSHSLESDLVGDTRKGSNFQTALLALQNGPLRNDVELLHAATKGAGTKETLMNDVLLGRSNADLVAIKASYAQKYSKTANEAVEGDLSLETRNHFRVVLEAQRAEESAPVVPEAIDQDVSLLHEATKSGKGKDHEVWYRILSTRNDNQIRAINQAYKLKYAKELERVIAKTFSGHMEDALLFQLRHAVDKYMHMAALLEDAMAGLGTKDFLLIHRVIRYHWDPYTMANVKGAYKQRYKKSLASRIKGETSGDYERLLLACIGGAE